MKLEEGIKKILKSEHKTQVELSKELGYSAHSGLGNAIRRNLTVDKLVEICNALDYDIVLVPRNGTDKKERSVVIDGTLGKKC